MQERRTRQQVRTFVEDYLEGTEERMEKEKRKSKTQKKRQKAKEDRKRIEKLMSTPSPLPPVTPRDLSCLKTEGMKPWSTIHHRQRRSVFEARRGMGPRRTHSRMPRPQLNILTLTAPLPLPLPPVFSSFRFEIDLPPNLPPRSESEFKPFHMTFEIQPKPRIPPQPPTPIIQYVEIPAPPKPIDEYDFLLVLSNGDIDQTDHLQQQISHLSIQARTPLFDLHRTFFPDGLFELSSDVYPTDLVRRYLHGWNQWRIRQRGVS